MKYIILSEFFTHTTTQFVTLNSWFRGVRVLPRILIYTHKKSREPLGVPDNDKNLKGRSCAYGWVYNLASPPLLKRCRKSMTDPHLPEGQLDPYDYGMYGKRSGYTAFTVTRLSANSVHNNDAFESSYGHSALFKWCSIGVVLLCEFFSVISTLLFFLTYPIPQALMLAAMLALFWIWKWRYSYQRKKTTASSNNLAYPTPPEKYEDVSIMEQARCKPSLAILNVNKLISCANSKLHSRRYIFCHRQF